MVNSQAESVRTSLFRSMRIIPEVRRLCQHQAMMPHLRLATRDDLAAVQAIVQAAYSHYIARIGRKPGPMLDDYATLIEKRQVHVAGRQGSIQGIIVLNEQGNTLLLDNMAVAPEAQDAGLGRMMLEFAERAAIERGYSTITLYTNEAMMKNITLYTRAGYEEIHRVEEKGLRRVYMR